MGRFVLVLLGQLLAREDACPADPVPAGRRAEDDHQVAGTPHTRAREALRREQPDAHRVDEAVAGVALVEDGLAADGRHADAVSVVAHSGDRAAEHPAGAPVCGVAETEGVEQRDRSRPHRDDVAQDAADAGRSSLERLDSRGMVVALDLEGDREPVADVDDARVLAGALQHRGPLRRQALEKQGRVLVAAMLRPEQAEDRELEVVGRAVEQSADTVELPVRQAERAMKRLFNDRGQGEVTSLHRDEVGGRGDAACLSQG